MDKRAAGLYLDKLFGDGQGHVAVAYKDKGASWQECQFAYPSERAKLIGWAEVHKDANVFICPALRKDAHTRKKRDMKPTSWLWADVDMDKVPADKRAEVESRIADIGTLVVSSGSGPNAHVYVELNAPVEAAEHIRLNTGLRDYLYADNKQADNSLLRLPGTTNWKTDTGNKVAVRGGSGRKVPVARLTKHRAFRDVRVIEDVDATDWDFVKVEGLPRRIRAMVQMSVEEAYARYKKRHAAVWAVSKELYKRGMGGDEIHSLMDKFPAAQSKAADENGYDVHRDVDKCIAYMDSIGELSQGLSEADRNEIEHQVQDEFEDAGEETEEERSQRWQEEIRELAESIRKRNDATKLARQWEAERTWVAPPPMVSWSLRSALRHPPQPVPHLIDGVCGQKHNVVITAQYKTGKTAFVMGSVASSLADGTPFLDRFQVNSDTGLVVGHWNCEMDPHEMMDDYIRPVGIENVDNLNVANLRGWPVNILSPLGRKWAVEWLRGELPDEDGVFPLPCKVWTIDSFARLARMAGVSEKDNDEVMSLLMALDEIKVEAGVDVLFLITHTGRTEMEEGKERARGATAIDDWADARWIMTKMDKSRFLRVEGRGVALDDSALVFDEVTKRSVLGFGGKTEVKEDTAKDAVVKIVQEQPGIGKTALLLALKGIGISNRAAAGPLEEAIEGGFIEVKMEQRKGKPAQCHYLAGTLKGETRAHGATPATIDMRGVRSSRLRSRA